MPVHRSLNEEVPQEILSSARRTFAQFDKDNSGTIDIKELRTLLTSLHVNVSDEELQILMDSVDEDRSGEIDFDEFVKVRPGPLRVQWPPEPVCQLVLYRTCASLFCAPAAHRRLLAGRHDPVACQFWQHCEQ